MTLPSGQRSKSEDRAGLPRGELASGHAGLPRQLGGWSALAVLVSMIIGSGIFRVPRAVAAATGSVAGVMFCWVLGGVIALCGVLSVAELSTMFPRAGGMYVYLREAYGGLTAFLLGWTDLVALPAAIAAVALVFANYARAFVPLGARETQGVAAALIVVVAAVNYRSLRLAALLQNVGTPAKVLALLGMTAVIFAFGRGDGALAHHAGIAPTTLGGVGVALITVLFSYDGWAQFSALAGEVRDPGRTLPRVFIGGMLLVIVIYLTANAAYLYALRIDEMATSPIVAADALRRAVGPAAGSFVSALVLLSTFGALNSLVMAEPRLFYAMAEDGAFFRGLAAVHPRNRTPHIAIMFTTALALLYVGFRSFDQLAETFVIMTWPFFTLAVAGVFVLRRRRPDAARPYRTVGYPFVPIVFITAGILLLTNAVVKHPVSTLASFGVVLLGWPVYLYWAAKSEARFRRRAGGLVR
jgi:amino acid transporter